MSPTATSTQAPGRLVALAPGTFRIPERLGLPVHLLGARCRACGETFFPKRVFCANCSSDSLEEVEMPERGQVQTYTVVHQQLPGSAMVPPYAIVRIALPNGVAVQTVMVEGDLASLAIGDVVDLVAGRIMEDDAGNTLISYLARKAQTEKDEVRGA